MSRRFDLCDAQDRCEQRENIVELPDRVRDRGARFVEHPVFKPIAQVERAAFAGHERCRSRPAEDFEEALDAIQHPVERRGDLVELILARLLSGIRGECRRG